MKIKRQGRGQAASKLNVSKQFSSLAQGESHKRQKRETLSSQKTRKQQSQMKENIILREEKENILM
jgi:hypothetical protein